MKQSNPKDSKKPEPVIKLTRRRSESDKQEFKEQLIALSRKILSERGADAVTVRSVALEAGISPMAMYRYFPGKTALVSYVMDDVLVSAMKYCNEQVARHRAPYTKLGAWLSSYVDFWLERPDYFRLVFLQPAMNPTAQIETSFWTHAKAPSLMKASLHGLLYACWNLDRVTVTDIAAVTDQIAIGHIGLLHYLIARANSPMVDVQQIRHFANRNMLEMVRNAHVWTKDKVKKHAP